MRRSIKDISTLPSWAEVNGIKLNGVTISTSPSGHGTGLIATTDHAGSGSKFIQVPAHLLLNKAKVWSLSTDDKDLDLVLRANREFAETIRGAILLFLFLQISHTSPDVQESGYKDLPIGKPNLFSDYVQYIQTEKNLPLFWSPEDAVHLWGTSLGKHHEAKIRFLVNEFDQFKAACSDLPWYEVWFGQHGCITFEDWLTVDAMWRSRAMELSNPENKERSSSLVPVMDMANHNRDGIAAYRVKIDNEDRLCAELILDETIHLEHTDDLTNTLQYNAETAVKAGTEITISYGSNKGATEMIFSYGFLDDSAFSDARAMMLGLTMPEDDPLADAKVEALQLEPGIQIYTPDHNQGLRFVSSAVWAMAVNEEDGLRIVEQSNINQEQTRRIQIYFKDTLITSKSHLVEVLEHDRASVVFQARAYGYVYQRIMAEIDTIEAEAERQLNNPLPNSSHKDLCDHLRYLEHELLIKARDYFLAGAQELMNTKDFQDYQIFLDGGPPLPPFDEGELWHRFQDEYDEENRREYVDSLLEQLSSVILTDDVESNNRNGWDSEGTRNDETAERDSSGSEAGKITITESVNDLLLQEQEKAREEWYYGENAQMKWDLVFDDDDGLIPQREVMDEALVT